MFKSLFHLQRLGWVFKSRFHDKEIESDQKLQVQSVRCLCTPARRV